MTGRGAPAIPIYEAEHLLLFSILFTLLGVIGALGDRDSFIDDQPPTGLDKAVIAPGKGSRSSTSSSPSSLNIETGVPISEIKSLILFNVYAIIATPIAGSSAATPLPHLPSAVSPTSPTNKSKRPWSLSLQQPPSPARRGSRRTRIGHARLAVGVHGGEVGEDVGLAVERGGERAAEAVARHEDASVGVLLLLVADHVPELVVGDDLAGERGVGGRFAREGVGGVLAVHILEAEHLEEWRPYPAMTGLVFSCSIQEHGMIL
uniref:Uncharacterized protein n=1 Tax=Oryza punctata TaxID=4537 RepID=A0A0E0L3T6_ORYPU